MFYDGDVRKYEVPEYSRLHLELIVFSLSPYKTYAVLCFRNPAVIFGRGYMPDKLVKHAATVYNRGN